ncbi:MAG: tRNA 2-selenouridine(34) synthase MnmH [Deinococcales bacterium]|nr:tRNA 2-selenouridine(34) synthase MnmH [Chitinophagaceae bacterium]
MAVEKISIDDFLQMPGNYLLLDVRSPSEFAQAHISGAISLPLFTDEERKVVGTAYKQQSREKAIKIGLTYFGPKMASIVAEVETIITSLKPATTTKNSTESITAIAKKIVVHCWRGGMRSAAVAWLLDLYSFKVYTIAGGYKTYRKWVLAQFEKQYNFKVIGGYTGSGKTELLAELQTAGETIIDFEGLAHHKGSAFGSLGQPVQPSQEMFENLIAAALHVKSNTNIWIEDESQRIGHVNLPATLYRSKQLAPIYFIEIPFNERLQYIITSYGKFEKDQLVSAIMRIKKRLGGLETKIAINFLIENNIKSCFEVLLRYYDKCYLKGLHQRENLENQLNKISCITVNNNVNAVALLAFK